MQELEVANHEGSVFEIAGCRDHFNISEPFEILKPFETELSEESGEPLVETTILLRAPGRPDVEAVSDEEGKISLLLPPDDYVVEVLED